MSEDKAFQPLGPRNNPHLFGQETAENALLAAAKSGRLPHGWLITGPQGIGKATLAFRFARFLLAGGATADAHSEGADLLGDAPRHGDLSIPADSPTFRQVAAAGHANLRVVESPPESKRGEISVEQVRVLIRFFQATAWEAGWRVAIVDGAEAMNRSAANAILKMLEEPPARSVFLLISHAPGRLLPTIRSRCRQLAMKPLADDPLRRALAHVRPDLPAAEIDAALPLAEGSVAQALVFLESGGLQLQEKLSALVDALPDLDVAALHAFAETAAKRDEDADNFAVTGRLISLTLGRIVRAAAGKEAGGSAGEAKLADRARQRPQGLDRWARLWENTGKRLDAADSASLDRKQVLMETFFELQAAARE